MEEERLKEGNNWKKWGPYLSERQWGTVREDSSQDGSCWEDFTHDQAVYRAYRWGEDGLLGITDEECNLCLALALWNGKDPVLKERLYGLSNPQANHGEDVKELYYYIDSTPTHSYMKALYKYPQDEFPYKKLEEENLQRTVYDREYELLDTGIFQAKKYFSVQAEYCKSTPTDILGRYTITNHGQDKAVLHILPTLWYRNVWSWGQCDAALGWKPVLYKSDDGKIICKHPKLGLMEVSDETKDLDENRHDPDAESSTASVQPQTSLKRKRADPVLGVQTAKMRKDGEKSTSTHQPQTSLKRKRQTSPASGPQAAKTRKVETSGVYLFEVDTDQNGLAPTIIFTENDTNFKKGDKSVKKHKTRFVKDSFHEYVIKGNHAAVHKSLGTKCAAHYIYTMAPGSSVVLKVRLHQTTDTSSPTLLRNGEFDSIFQQRIQEAEDFYNKVCPFPEKTLKDIYRQAYAGLLWNKQFYYLVQREWDIRRRLQTPHIMPSAKSYIAINRNWGHLYCKDIITMPDKWEFPWFAAWDLALQTVPLANIDIQFAMSQLELLLQEGYMHSDGRIPAFEFSFGDTNPPLHAYAALRVFRKSQDTAFLRRCFTKLQANFKWWLENMSLGGRKIFTGGFLGLDNISVFDRSHPPVKKGFYLAQADATAWMALYSLNMLEITLILARDDLSQHTNEYQNKAVNFLKDFLEISEEMNRETGLWNDIDGFYYDHILGSKPYQSKPLRIKSMVGLISLFGSYILHKSDLEHHPNLQAYITDNREKLVNHVSCSFLSNGNISLSLVSKERLVRILGHVLDEEKFLSPFGVRALSKEYKEQPYVLEADEWSEYVEFLTRASSRKSVFFMEPAFKVDYEPGESHSGLFGGNSNWRGPVWMPVNFLLIEGLQSFYGIHGDDMKVQFPTRSGPAMSLKDITKELAGRLLKLFVPGADNQRPCHGSDTIYATDPYFKNLCLFYEYFHGDSGRGCGASHQTGWTALICNLLDNYVKS